MVATLKAFVESFNRSSARCHGLPSARSWPLAHAMLAQVRASHPQAQARRVAHPLRRVPAAAQTRFHGKKDTVHVSVRFDGCI